MANFCFNYESKIGHVERDVIYIQEICILYSQLLHYCATSQGRDIELRRKECNGLESITATAVQPFEN